MPVFFFWMYWMNGASPVWLGSVSAMILVYYHLTDWRLASLGTLSRRPGELAADADRDLDAARSCRGTILS